jgi:hypothetical protein
MKCHEIQALKDYIASLVVEHEWDHIATSDTDDSFICPHCLIVENRPTTSE